MPVNSLKWDNQLNEFSATSTNWTSYRIMNLNSICLLNKKRHTHIHTLTYVLAWHCRSAGAGFLFFITFICVCTDVNVCVNGWLHWINRSKTQDRDRTMWNNEASCFYAMTVFIGKREKSTYIHTQFTNKNEKHIRAHIHPYFNKFYY